MVQSLPGFLNLCLNVCSPCQVLGDVYTEVLEATHPLHRGPIDHKRSVGLLLSLPEVHDQLLSFAHVQRETVVLTPWCKSLHLIQVCGLIIVGKQMYGVTSPVCRSVYVFLSVYVQAPCFTVGMVFFGCNSAFFLLQTRQVELLPKSSILVSSDLMPFSQSSSGSSKCSLANFRRAWTCTGLSRGTRLALQDLSPWRRSVLMMVAFVTLVPALCRSFSRSPRVVLGFLLTVLVIILTPRGEILRGAPDRGRLSVVLYVFHFLIIAPTVDFFTPSCLPIADSVFPAWCRSTILFLVSFDSSLVLAIVEFGVWLFEVVDRCLLYW